MENREHRLKLLIDGTGNKGWIGGLYYKRNILFSLLSNADIAQRVAITVITEKQHAAIFAPFDNQIEIKYISYKYNLERKIKLMLWARSLRAKFIFPSIGKWGQLAGCSQINWIPDFQHNRMREFFSEEEYNSRTNSYRRIADSESALILSSQDCLKDFREFYSETKENVYVVPFVSYIAPELNVLSHKLEQATLHKFGLSEKKYVAVMNQFWKHKNHKVIFQAMHQFFADYPKADILFVFTGMMDDYRNPEYIHLLKKLLEEPGVKNHTVMLGFIDRTEQLILMKHAELIIQPSLFEGWGTVVEDAKVLDKTILLSDIPVHREQKNEKCILFDPHDPKELAMKIAQESEKNHRADLTLGLNRMTESAIQYSSGFHNLLLDVEKRDYE